MNEDSFPYVVLTVILAGLVAYVVIEQLVDAPTCSKITTRVTATSDPLAFHPHALP